MIIEVDDEPPGQSSLLDFLEEIKFSHTVFALPFALVAMVIAAEGMPSLWTFFWIVIACVAARTAAMCFNRLMDARFDAENPRTKKRALVSGKLSASYMWNRLLISSLVFFFAAGMLNEACLYLSPPTLAILLGYSFAKRFSKYSHYILGLALGLAPIGAWIAVRESVGIVPILLSLAVIFWVAGFDILYSCQDYDVDSKSDELHSVPKAKGIAGAMLWAKISHGISLIFFFLFWLVSPLGFLGLFGIIIIGALLVRQHLLVSPTDLSRIDAAFFTSNGIISVVFLLMVILDFIW